MRRTQPGTADHFDPWPVRRLTVALETTPLTDNQAASLGWRERQPFYTNDLPLLWGRALPRRQDDRRARAAIDEYHRAEINAAFRDAGARLIARVRGLHPAARALDAVRIWAGPIARNDEGIRQYTGIPRSTVRSGRAVTVATAWRQRLRLGAVAARRMIEP